MKRYNLKHRDLIYPIITPNYFNAKCTHSYQVNNGLIPYEVEVKTGDTCPCCKEIVPEFPRYRVFKRYGHCVHSWEQREKPEDIGHTSIIPGCGRYCPFCGELVEVKAETFRWESLRPQALLDRMQQIKPLIVVGSRWLDKAEEEVYTIYKIDGQDNSYEMWMPFVNPHPENTHWYISPEKLAEGYEPI